MTGPLFKRSTEALFCEVGADIVALNVEKGQCYGMENVTAVVWNLLEEPATTEQLCDKLVQIYEVPAETCRLEIERLMALLQEEGLIEPVRKAPVNKAALIS